MPIRITSTMNETVEDVIQCEGHAIPPVLALLHFHCVKVCRLCLSITGHHIACLLLTLCCVYKNGFRAIPICCSTSLEFPLVAPFCQLPGTSMKLALLGPYVLR